MLVELAAHSRPVKRLPSDREIPALSALAEGWAQQARRTHFVNTTNRGVGAREVETPRLFPERRVR